MSEEQCFALWKESENKYRCETILAEDLGEFTLLRWKRQQEASVYYIYGGTDIRDDRAAVVWQDDDGEWQYCYDDPPDC